MKKMVSVILSVCLLLTLLPTTVFAADQTADAGARIVEKSYDDSTKILTVDMQIKLPNAVGITSVATMISYDSSKLTLLHASNDEISYIATETREQRKAAVKCLLTDKDDEPYTKQESALYGKDDRAALLVLLGSVNGPNDSQKTTDWLSIYSLRFKVSGPAATTLDSTSLRIADPDLENELVKYTYDNAHVNNYYTVAVVDGKTGLEYYFGKMKDNPEGELSGMKHLMAATGNNTATYPGSSNAPSTPTTYTVSFDANGGTGGMAGATGVSGEYTLPANGFTAPNGKQFKAWSVGGVEKAVGDKITVTANTTVTAVWEAIEYNVTVTGGTASVGAGTPITKATMGTTVTLTAGAAPTGKVFDKWEVVSGGITLADANSATTTFTMPASAVSVKATYKNAPHTHTYNQETVKPEALKTPAGCTNNAVYFKSCSCGAISTTDTFVAMNTALGHAHGSDWKYDSTNHWHECSRCHDKKDEAAHDYGSDNICDTCGYDKTVPHTHNLTLVAAKSATCTAPGNADYWKCNCGKLFSDNTATAETTLAAVTIAALGHDHNGPWVTTDENEHWKVCAREGCNEQLDKAVHNPSAWVNVDDGHHRQTCIVCEKELEYERCIFGQPLKYNATSHWEECTKCGNKQNEAAHEFLPNSDKCTGCDYTKSSTITIITPTQPGDSKPAEGNPSTGAVSSPVGYVFVGLAVVGALCLGAKKLTKKHED